ncbi:MAG: RNA-binding transcriptional accessory protein [Clostridia bacterium]|nr:RNA-binding transcriptional accessory protein [Clostridia bacterium]
MNQDIVNEIALELNVKSSQVENVLKLLEDGNTVPFIARYRKEATGALDEEQIRKINEVYEYQVNLLKRKEDVIRLIEEKGMMNDELKAEIMKCVKLVEVEDLYRPYKEKKKTKATEAIALGLEPLAKIIMSFPVKIDISEAASGYITDKVLTVEDAIQGAKYIIAEWISDNAAYRKYIRNNIFNFGTITSKIKKKAEDEGQVYKMYYDYSEKIKFAKSHRILAINRGEKENVLTVSIEIDTEHIMNFLEKKIIKKKESPVVDIVKDAIVDAYKRLIFPSIEREIRADLKEEAEEGAIGVFGKNLEKLLLTPPMKDKVVLGFDPAFRTGCKLAVIDPTSRVLNISKIYPHEPHNKWVEAKTIIKQLIKVFNVDIIAVGNGTASRESEKLVSEVCKEYKEKKVEYIIVSEAGASVYSASKLAISEFPDLHVEERSAISIGRRLQDSLSELVKIDPKSIGVGQYQHDVNQKRLNESLDFVVSKAVNLVGVNVNTASPSILKYISGLTKTNIDKIVKYREENGKIQSREELVKKKVLSAKAYEQSIGFMRVIDGKNLLDKTPIHPESYDATIKLIENIGMTVEDIGTEELNKKLDALNLEKYASENGIDNFTLEDIIKCLKQPNRDFRDDFTKPLLKSDILRIEDLTVGMKLEGTVRNVVDFGAFIDIGLHDDGLAHISKLTKEYIKHPLDVVSVGDIVTCYVDKVDLERQKVNLSLIDPSNVD